MKNLQMLYHQFGLVLTILFSNLFVSGQIHQMSPNYQALLKNHSTIVLLGSFLVSFFWFLSILLTIYYHFLNVENSYIYIYFLTIWLHRNILSNHIHFFYYQIIFLQLNVNFPIFAKPVLQKLKIVIYGSQESVFWNVIMIHFQKMRIMYTPNKANIQKQRIKVNP